MFTLYGIRIYVDDNHLECNMLKINPKVILHFEFFFFKFSGCLIL